MIIKIIPEEGDTISEVEHKNVNEFFIFGNKKDDDGDLVDFHDWKGAYRYLLGSLAYFEDVIKDERGSNRHVPSPAAIQRQKQIELKDLKPPVEDAEVEGVDNVIELHPQDVEEVEETKEPETTE